MLHVTNSDCHDGALSPYAQRVLCSRVVLVCLCKQSCEREVACGVFVVGSGGPALGPFPFVLVL